MAVDWPGGRGQRLTNWGKHHDKPRHHARQHHTQLSGSDRGALGRTRAALPRPGRAQRPGRLLAARPRDHGRRPRRLDGTEHTRVRRALLRHPPGRGHRGPDEPAVQGPRGGLPPVRLRRRPRARLAWRGRPGRRGRQKRGHRPGGHRARGPRRYPRPLRPRPGGRGPGGHRHRRDPVHVGHHRAAEGRRADPREPAQQRRGHQDHAAEPAAGRRSDGSAAALPFLRPDGRDGVRRRHWRVPDPAAEVRPCPCAGDHQTGPGDRAARRPDDVRRSLARRERQPRGCGQPAAVRVRRRGHAGRADARVREALRLHGP